MRMTEKHINFFNSLEGSTACIEKHYLIPERLLADAGATVDKKVVWRLAIAGTVAAFCGTATAPIVVGSDVWKALGVNT